MINDYIVTDICDGGDFLKYQEKFDKLTGRDMWYKEQYLSYDYNIDPSKPFYLGDEIRDGIKYSGTASSLYADLVNTFACMDSRSLHKVILKGIDKQEIYKCRERRNVFQSRIFECPRINYIIELAQYYASKNIHFKNYDKSHSLTRKTIMPVIKDTPQDEIKSNI